MYKLFFLFLMMFSSVAFAEGNVFCESQPTSSPDCMKGAYVMYLGFLNGYTKSMVKYKQENNQEVNEEEEVKKIMELMPYDIFFEELFKGCGESKKDMDIAQACLLSRFQEHIMKKMEKES